MNVDLQSLMGLQGKRALVVGGGLGIGLSTAASLRACGVELAIVERDADRLHAAAAELGAFPIEMDVTEPGSGARGVEAASAGIGPLDILVNVVGRGLKIAAAEQSTDDGVELMKVNYFHHVDFGGAFAKSCIAGSRPGVIAIVSSLAGTAPFPDRAGYGAAKAALDSYVRSAAVELGPKSVRINAVAPGVVHTDRSVVSEAAAAQFGRAIPMGRVATQQEVANTLLFLCSDLSSYSTGQTMLLDGGASLFTRMWPDS